MGGDPEPFLSSVFGEASPDWKALARAAPRRGRALWHMDRHSPGLEAQEILTRTIRLDRFLRLSCSALGSRREKHSPFAYNRRIAAGGSTPAILTAADPGAASRAGVLAGDRAEIMASALVIGSWMPQTAAPHHPYGSGQHRTAPASLWFADVLSDYARL